MTTLTEQADGSYVLQFDQGATTVWHIPIYTDETDTTLEDLTGYAARGMGRESYGTIETSPFLFSIDCTVSSGIVTCVITPASSTANTTVSGVYDIELYSIADSDTVYRIQRGVWNMSQEVTLND